MAPSNLRHTYGAQQPEAYCGSMRWYRLGQGERWGSLLRCALPCCTHAVLLCRCMLQCGAYRSLTSITCKSHALWRHATYSSRYGAERVSLFLAVCWCLLNVPPARLMHGRYAPATRLPHACHTPFHTLSQTPATRLACVCASVGGLRLCCRVCKGPGGGHLQGLPAARAEVGSYSDFFSAQGIAV